MRKYWFKDYGFGNVYDVVYTETPEQEAEALRRGYERIPYAEAKKLCVQERYRRKYDEAFSGYAPTYIYPITGEYDYIDPSDYKQENTYVMVRR